jgi:hypothetical protein
VGSEVGHVTRDLAGAAVDRGQTAVNVVVLPAQERAGRRVIRVVVRREGVDVAQGRLDAERARAVLTAVDGLEEPRLDEGFVRGDRVGEQVVVRVAAGVGVVDQVLVVEEVGLRDRLGRAIAVAVNAGDVAVAAVEVVEVNVNLIEVGFGASVLDDCQVLDGLTLFDEERTGDAADVSSRGIGESRRYRVGRSVGQAHRAQESNDCDRR